MRKGWSILVMPVASCAMTPASTVSDQAVEAKAQECGLSVQHLEKVKGPNGKSEWSVGLGPDGTIPKPEGLVCFLEWGQKQHGIRVGFISEPPL